MNPHSDEEEFRVLFAQMRRGDEPHAPAFDPNGRVSGLRSDSLLSELRYGRLIALILAAGVFVATLSVAHHRRPDRGSIALKPSTGNVNVDLVAEPAAPSLGDWKSPTAFLLRPADEWDEPSQSPADSPSFAPATQPQPHRSS